MSVESHTLSSSWMLFSSEPVSELTFKQENVLTYAPASNHGFSSLKADFFRVEELFSLLLGSQFRLDWPTLVQQSDDEFGSWHRAYFYRALFQSLSQTPMSGGRTFTR